VIFYGSFAQLCFFLYTNTGNSTTDFATSGKIFNIFPLYIGLLWYECLKIKNCQNFSKEIISGKGVA